MRKLAEAKRAAEESKERLEQARDAQACVTIDIFSPDFLVLQSARRMIVLKLI